MTKDKFLKKGKDKYQNRGGKQEAAKYYEDNQEVLRKARNQYRNLSEVDEEVKREYARNRYRNIKGTVMQIEKVLKNHRLLVSKVS